MDCACSVSSCTVGTVRFPYRCICEFKTFLKLKAHKRIVFFLQWLLSFGEWKYFDWISFQNPTLSFCPVSAFFETVESLYIVSFLLDWIDFVFAGLLSESYFRYIDLFKLYFKALLLSTLVSYHRKLAKSDSLMILFLFCEFHITTQYFELSWQLKIHYFEFISQIVLETTCLVWVDKLYFQSSNGEGEIVHFSS